MIYKYKNNTFIPDGDYKIPDGVYILFKEDSSDFVIMETDKFETVINRITGAEEHSSKILRLILAKALQVKFENGRMYLRGGFFAVDDSGKFYVEKRDGFYIFKSTDTCNSSPLINIIEKCLYN